MDVSFRPEGIYIEALDLWLDPQVSKPTAWVSHAHSDHARQYPAVLFGTPLTLEIYRMRWPSREDVTQELRPLRYGESVEFRGGRLSAYPSGHILGAAQLLIEFGGERLVYTGDLKLRQPLCGEPTQIVHCDQLIVESTFGLPIYHFLGREEAQARILQFAEECLEEGVTPVFTGYPLGRGQEIAHVLCQAGVPTAVHGAIAKYIPVYESAGYEFPQWQEYDARDLAGKAVVVVPGMKRNLEAKGVSMRSAYVSGWAGVDNARLRAAAEVLIPYSDHADFDELLEIVAKSGARRVDVVHGYAEALARILRNRGVGAQAPQAAMMRSSEEEAA